jgi:DNA-directed RNA polymerase subunit beta'
LLKNAEGESLQRLDFDRRRIFKYFDTLPADNQYLDDFDPTNLLPKWEQSIMDLLAELIFACLTN